MQCARVLLLRVRWCCRTTRPATAACWDSPCQQRCVWSMQLTARVSVLSSPTRMLPCHPQYLAWAELILASALNPRVSFLGHLCGIVAGAGLSGCWHCLYIVNATPLQRCAIPFHPIPSHSIFAIPGLLHVHYIAPAAARGLQAWRRAVHGRARGRPTLRPSPSGSSPAAASPSGTAAAATAAAAAAAAQQRIRTAQQRGVPASRARGGGGDGADDARPVAALTADELRQRRLQRFGGPDARQ
jgi:hypothetical protein